MCDTVERLNRRIRMNLNDRERREISDGYHNFGELYEHRHALFIALCRTHPQFSWKSQKHEDGTMHRGWFVAGIRLPTGDITYHLPMTLFSELNVTELENAPEWDGHESQDVIDRLKAYDPRSKGSI